MVMKPRGSVIQRTKPSPRTEVSSEGGGGIPALALPVAKAPGPGLAPEGGSSRGKGKPPGTAPRPALRSPRSAHPARPRAQGPAAPSSRTVPHPTPGDTTAGLWLPEARRRKPNVLRGHFAKG